jgi:hypothetical protein
VLVVLGDTIVNFLVTMVLVFVDIYDLTTSLLVVMVVMVCR